MSQKIRVINRRQGRKLGNLENLGNLRNFFPRFLNASFQSWL